MPSTASLGHSAPAESQSAFFLPTEQNAVVSFKELCGLSSVANLMQCMLAVSPRFLGPDNTPLVVLNLSEQYPTMELQGIVPEVLKKIVTTYDMVSGSSDFQGAAGERGVLGRCPWCARGSG